MREQIVSNLKRVVVKIGTSVLLDQKGNISVARIRRLAEEAVYLLEKKIKVIFVSSGAISYGMQTLGLNKRPKELPVLQACAAVGQGKLMKGYEEAFSRFGYHTGQLLLTRDGLEDRKRYLNTRNTVDELLRLNVVPIANENDTVSTEEIKFGDNDILATQVTTLLNADLLVILSDIDGFYERHGGSKKVFSFINQIDASLQKHLHVKTGEKTVGGMSSKLQAAERLLEAGIPMVIANGRKKGVLKDLINGVHYGTLFFSGKTKRSGFENWLAFSATPSGSLRLDAGAVEALQGQGRSLLAAGVRAVNGDFEAGDVVAVENPEGRVFAHGIANFSKRDLKKILGKKTAEITAVLGQGAPGEVIHRDNFALLQGSRK